MKTSIENALNLIADKEYLKAQEELKKLIALFPDEKELYNLYAYCENCIEEICEKEEFENPTPTESEPSEPSTWQKFYPAAQQAADEGKYAKACMLLRLLETTPELGPTPYLSEPRARAVLCKEQAICYFLQGDLENAKDRYLRALDIEIAALPPNSYERAPFFIKKKDYTEALRLLKIGSFTAYFSDRSNVLYQKYQLHQLMGDNTKAYNALDKALRYKELDLKAHPYAYYSYDQYADWLVEQGNLKEALRQNSKAIALWPKFYGYQVKRAAIYARMGQKEQALRQLTLLEKGNWSRLESYLPSEKANVYEQLGDLKTAEEYYRKPTLFPLSRYDNLCDFYARYKRMDDIENLRREQRQEPHFQNRVSESELMALI